MGLPSHICVKRSTRARRMALRLDPKDRVFHLVVPNGVSLRRAEAFAEGHEDWMQEQLQGLPDPIAFDHGTYIPIFGKRTLIKIYYEPDAKRTDVILEGGILYVHSNKPDPTPRIIRFLKNLVKEELIILSESKAASIRKRVASISVRDTKSRWGSCSSDGQLSYSWRLIFAPYEALDYVVAHEVAHLQHLDHSKAFWKLCRGLSDNFIEGQYWMRNNGHELMRYGAAGVTQRTHVQSAVA